MKDKSREQIVKLYMNGLISETDAIQRAERITVLDELERRLEGRAQMVREDSIRDPAIFYAVSVSDVRAVIAEMRKE